MNPCHNGTEDSIASGRAVSNVTNAKKPVPLNIALVDISSGCVPVLAKPLYDQDAQLMARKSSHFFKYPTPRILLFDQTSNTFHWKIVGETIGSKTVITSEFEENLETVNAENLPQRPHVYTTVQSFKQSSHTFQLKIAGETIGGKTIKSSEPEEKPERVHADDLLQQPNMYNSIQSFDQSSHVQGKVFGAALGSKNEIASESTERHEAEIHENFPQNRRFSKHKPHKNTIPTHLPENEVVYGHIIELGCKISMPTFKLYSGIQGDMHPEFRCEYRSSVVTNMHGVPVSEPVKGGKHAKNATDLDSIHKGVTHSINLGIIHKGATHSINLGIIHKGVTHATNQDILHKGVTHATNQDILHKGVTHATNQDILHKGVTHATNQDILHKGVTHATNQDILHIANIENYSVKHEACSSNSDIVQHDECSLDSDDLYIEDTSIWAIIRPTIYMREDTPNARPMAAILSFRDNDFLSHEEVKYTLESQIGAKVKSIQFDPLNVRVCKPRVRSRWIVEYHTHEDLQTAVNHGLIVGRDRILIFSYDDIAKREVSSFKYFMTIRGNKGSLTGSRHKFHKKTSSDAIIKAKTTKSLNTHKKVPA